MLENPLNGLCILVKINVTAACVIYAKILSSYTNKERIAYKSNQTTGT